MGGHEQQRVADGLARWLELDGDCDLEPGLTAVEIERAERVFGIEMPPLWRRVLGLVHPVSLPKPPRDPDGVLRWTPYPDWRLRDEAGTAELLRRPVDGVLFDVEHNDFWWIDWGGIPSDLAGRLSVARELLERTPRLTPLHGNLYVGPTDDSPVFGINQTDLYVPALCLADLVNGRGQGSVTPDEYPIGRVRFWSELHKWSQIGHLAWPSD
jgi:hypothetical protein